MGIFYYETLHVRRSLIKEKSGKRFGYSLVFDFVIFSEMIIYKKLEK